MRWSIQRIHVISTLMREAISELEIINSRLDDLLSPDKSG